MNACRQLFGGQCTTSHVSEELLTYSDYRLHDFALRHNLHSFLLGEEAVMSSAKCQLMVELLKDLQVNPPCTYHQFVLTPNSVIGMYTEISLIRECMLDIIATCWHALC